VPREPPWSDFGAEHFTEKIVHAGPVTAKIRAILGSMARPAGSRKYFVTRAGHGASNDLRANPPLGRRAALSSI